MTKATQRGCCVRMNSLTEDRYLQRDGTFGDYASRARYHSEKAAEKAAQRAGVEVYGIFP